ncbi:hypothetical protein V496_03168 [Pseudogymnoascus sp. VKM F-4515 (FW-2607)]|nr:hypothetical protein V496_03168 [Pseudogymnoascus sp. VKM F-4515 (FW-2607)]
MGVNDMLDNAAGKAHKNHGESLRTFLASLTTSGAIFGFGITAYILLRRNFPDYYYERAHRVFNSKWKPRPMSLKMLLSPVPDPHIKHASGFENYLFDRYLHTVMRVFLTLGLIIMPILIPLNIVLGKNESGGVKGLDLLSISNIGLSHTDKYWAHLLLAILVVVLHLLLEVLGASSTRNISSCSGLLYSSTGAPGLF